MKTRAYKVRFARPVVGDGGVDLGVSLSALHASNSPHLPARDLGSERFQVRDLHLVGQVWKGTFGRLRDDAPHKVTLQGDEVALDLAEGDRLLEKCHFLYRKHGNLLVWQMNMHAGGLTRFEEYLSRLTGKPVQAPVVMNDQQIEEVLQRSVYEVSYSFGRPPALAAGSPKWSQSQFDTMRRMDAGHAAFLFRAQRGGSLSTYAKDLLRQALETPGVHRLRVRLTDDKDPLELFAAPLQDKIEVQMIGRYAHADDVFSGLEEAYDRNRAAFGGAEPGSAG